MSSTNKTQYYDLPQWSGSDNPSFSGDFNPAFLAIDTALKELEDKIANLPTKQSVLESVFPVGSVYTTFDTSVTDPKSVLNFGTWERIENRFLFATNTTSTGNTGGASTHTLTVDEMPAHNHNIMINNNKVVYGAPGIATTGSANLTTNGYTSGRSSVSVSSTGEGQPIEIMPPYLTVNMWKRTA